MRGLLTAILRSMLYYDLLPNTYQNVVVAFGNNQIGTRKLIFQCQDMSLVHDQILTQYDNVKFEIFVPMNRYKSRS